MIREEAIKWMEETIQDAEGLLDKCSPALKEEVLEQNEVFKIAISALRSAPQPGKPLTLDQLREMDGQPVWIVEYPDWGHWELSEDANDYIVDRNLNFYGMKHDDPDGRYGLHKLGWLAYSYPPAQQRWIKEANMPPTNGDHIRAMDDKELSDWICSIMTSECCDRTCPGREFCELGHKGLLDWLQATYKEEI